MRVDVGEGLLFNLTHPHPHPTPTPTPTHPPSPSRYILLFSVLKKWVHYRIGQCVRPSGCLHHNSSKVHPIVMKFCSQNCLINISVEFEDENDSARNGWVIATKFHYFLCFSMRTLTYPGCWRRGCTIRSSSPILWRYL
jgi:hypothetical protein